MKIPFKDLVLSRLRENKKSPLDIAEATGTSLSTIYRKLADPDSLSREQIRIIHKHTNLSYEDLMERR